MIIISIKKGSAPPRYDNAFKTGAVKMVTEQGRSVKETASDLGICVDTLRSWLKTSGVLLLTISAETIDVSVNWKPKSVPFENNLPRKTRLYEY